MSAMRPHPILLPAAWLYGGAMAVRNRCFEIGIFGSTSVGVPVISVGNMTAGGTGKTPLVAEIARRLHAGGKKVGIVSRGYGRRSNGPLIVARGDGTVIGEEDAGDEAAMLALQLRETIIVVAERRTIAAEIAVRELGAEVIVVDDGFQHRALCRDLDILVVDGRTDLLLEPMLPAGLRREPLSGIGRAGLVGVSKVQGPGEVKEIGRRLQTRSHAPVFGFKPVLDAIVDFRTGTPVHDQSGTNAYLMSGIGDPEGFAATVRESGCRVVARTVFEDHHRYTVAEVRSVISAAGAAGAGFIATTEKDAMRLRTTEIEKIVRGGTMAFLVYRVRADIFEGESFLTRALAATVAGETQQC